MNKPYITAILAITSLSFSAGGMAQEMSRIEYKAAEKNIKVDYKSAKANCASFAGHAKDICMAQAKGDEKVAKAELEARYMPSIKSDYKVSVAGAEEHYAVSIEKCDDKTGKANTNEESSAARIKAKEKGGDARQDAAVGKRDAGYDDISGLADRLVN